MEEYARQFFEPGLCDDLQVHLTSYAIKSRKLFPGTPDCIHSSVLLFRSRILIGCLRVEGRGFEFMDVCASSMGGGGKGGERSVTRLYHYGYVLPGKVRGPIKDLAVQLKVIKKGIISREIVGFEWKGGSLADSLNSDQELMKELNGLAKDSPSLGISPRTSGSGTTLQVYADGGGDFVTVWQPVRDPRDFPSQGDIRIAESIAGHIRHHPSGPNN